MSAINKKLLPMKMVMFGYFGAYACAIPYMTLHMKELGLTVEETAIIYTLLPVTQCVSSPLAGFIADRLGKYRDVLLVALLMTIILATALLYVPAVHHPSCSDSCPSFIQHCSSNCNQSSDVPTTLDPCPPTSDFNDTSRCNCSLNCQEGNRKLTFFLYSFLRIVYNIFSSIGFTLVNSCALALTETCAGTGEYGRQRLWAMLAMAIFSPLAGMFVDLMRTTDSTSYAPAFHAHNALALLTCIAVWYLNFEMEDAPTSYKETFRNFWTLLQNPSIFFLLIIIFWLGTVWGFLESFLFWFLLELKSPTYLMGLTVTVGSLVGVPFLYYARWLVSRLGHINLLSLALLMYMVRGIGCSFLKDPWWIMPFEVLEVFTYHLMWVAAATYAVKLSPQGLLATIQGVIEGLHYGVGQGSGSLIGGSLISVWGNRRAFQIIGIISGCLALIYSSLHFLWLRKIKIKIHSRRASIKSYNSQKTARNNSDTSGIASSLHLSIQESPA